MKFELVEPSDWEDVAVSVPTDVQRPGGVAFASHEVRAERMRKRTEDLGTRLTRLIEAVRPALNRMDANIVRAEREMAGTGHGSSAEVPENFRSDRFAAPATTPTQTLASGGER